MKKKEVLYVNSFSSLMLIGIWHVGKAKQGNLSIKTPKNERPLTFTRLAEKGKVVS
jgi:hypothetical protein